MYMGATIYSSQPWHLRCVGGGAWTCRLGRQVGERCLLCEAEAVAHPLGGRGWAQVGGAATGAVLCHTHRATPYTAPEHAAPTHIADSASSPVPALWPGCRACTTPSHPSPQLACCPPQPTCMPRRSSSRGSCSRHTPSWMSRSVAAPASALLTANSARDAAASCREASSTRGAPAPPLLPKPSARACVSISKQEQLGQRHTLSGTAGAPIVTRTDPHESAPWSAMSANESMRHDRCCHQQSLDPAH
jgi:hypothetical protein